MSAMTSAVIAQVPVGSLVQSSRRRSGWGSAPAAAPAVSIVLQQRSSHPRGVAASIGGRLQPLPPLAAAAPVVPAVARFIEAFNQRSVAGMASCLASAAVYHNLSYPQPFSGKQAVEGMLSSLVAGAPPDWRLVVDDASGDAGATGLVFHMEDGAGRAVPLSQGVAFYRLDAAGHIAHITEASEQVFKVPQVALSAIGAAAPLLQALSSGPLGALFPTSGMAGRAGQPAAAAAAAAAPPAAYTSTSPAASTSSNSNFAAARDNTVVAATAGASGSSGPSNSSDGGAATSSSSSSSPSSSIPPNPSSIAGVWLKDAAASDLASYGRACDLMQLGTLQKATAMQLIEGLEIDESGDQLAVRFLTVVPFFKVTESYRLGGTVTMGRRDLRRGTQLATAQLAPDGSLRINIWWEEPNKGGVEEVYRLIDASGGTLECLSTVSVAAGAVTTRTVYSKSKGGWSPRFKWNPLAGALGVQ